MWGPKKNHKGDVVAQYADDKFCWSAGCTWERYEKFEAGDLKDCEASQKALQDFEKWYADSKYGDEDEDVLPHYKGLPFRKVKGKNDREVVIRDDIEGHEKWAFFATAEVKNKDPRTLEDEREVHRKKNRAPNRRGKDVHDDSDSESDEPKPEARLPRGR